LLQWNRRGIRDNATERKEGRKEERKMDPFYWRFYSNFEWLGEHRRAFATFDFLRVEVERFEWLYVRGWAVHGVDTTFATQRFTFSFMPNFPPGSESFFYPMKRGRGCLGVFIWTKIFLFTIITICITVVDSFSLFFFR